MTFFTENSIRDVSGCSLEVICQSPKDSSDLGYPAIVAHIGQSWFQLDDGPSIHLDEPPLTIIVQGDDSVLYDDFTYTARDTYWLSYEDLKFNASYLQENGECQPEQFYRWGFSSLLLFVFCVMSLIFLSKSSKLS